jgi:hypothetical protein
VFNDETGRFLSNIIVALGGPMVLLAFGKTVWDWVKGRPERKARKRQGLQAQLEEVDYQRRRALEYASQLRRQLMEEDIDPEPWPKELGRAPRIRPLRPTAEEIQE